MAVIEISNPIPGVYSGLFSAGAPVAGTDEVQTITIGGTPTGGTFRLRFDGLITADIPWANVNATLIASIDAALEALPNIGVGGVATAVGTMTAGIGTATVTFSGAALAKQAVTTLAVETNAMIGTAPTIAVAETTPGVTATGRGAPKGATLTRLDTGVLYINTGTTTAPTWTVVGAQT